jgi:flavin-binding protein dodecin
MTHVAKVIEIIGSSDKGWEDAAQVAVDEARKTLHGGKIALYRTGVKISFGVEH